MTGAVFKEEHQGQGNSKGADKEVQSNGITIGIFFRIRPWMALRYFVPKRSLR